MNAFHYAAAAGWENSSDLNHNDDDHGAAVVFFREGLIYNLIVCLSVYLCRAFHFNP